MRFEDDSNPSGTVTKVTRNLLGARLSPSPRVIVSRGGGWEVGSTSPTLSEATMKGCHVKAIEGGSGRTDCGFTPPPDPLPASGEGEFGYPLYDDHGNCRAILTKNGTSYGTGNWRTCDEWRYADSRSTVGMRATIFSRRLGYVIAIEEPIFLTDSIFADPHSVGRQWWGWDPLGGGDE